jgi:hypothetical protein
MQEAKDEGNGPMLNCNIHLMVDKNAAVSIITRAIYCCEQMADQTRFLCTAVPEPLYWIGGLDMDTWRAKADLAHSKESD